jgi:NADH:ubiquinone oxidoreductase subunit E
MIVSICVGSACHLKGSYTVVENLRQLVSEHGLSEQVTLKSSFCLGHCSGAVSVKVDETIHSVSPEQVDAFFDKEILGKTP